MIGAMIRLNKNSSTSYSSYLFLLDRHDTNGGGVNSGANNGINKILNKNLPQLTWNIKDNATKLSVNTSLRWTRNTWQNYKLIIKGNKIEAYIDNTLVASAIDSSIASGTYGFVCLSQANTYFKDIVIKTNKTKTFTELLSSINWEFEDINVIVNLNNINETALETQSCIDTFTNYDIHYIGVSSVENKTNIEQFVQNINGNGKWIDSTNYDTYTQEIIKYLIDIF